MSPQNAATLGSRSGLFDSAARRREFSDHLYGLPVERQIQLIKRPRDGVNECQSTGSTIVAGAFASEYLHTRRPRLAIAVDMNRRVTLT